MICNARRSLSAVLLAMSVLTIGESVRAQNSVAVTRPAISVLDSTKEQDGLIGSVRRIKTETAKIEIKDGREVEGPAKLVELTTYGIKGNRIENTSYPIGGSLVGKEEYKYDERGNITEMTLRDDRGAILSREAYTYEFDKFGNWTKMVTSLVVFENGELKREPIEVTRRTLTYYFDDSVAKAVETPVPQPIPDPIRVSPVPEPKTPQVEVGTLEVSLSEVRSTVSIGEAPAVPTPIITDQKRAYDLYVNGRSQFDAGDAHAAIESYLQSIKLESGSAEVFLNLGHAYLKLEKNTDAIKAFKESVKLNPDVAETQYGYAVANFRARRFKDAADAFKKATTLSPQMAKAHYGLSLAYQELGNTQGLLQEHRLLERLDRSLARKLEQTFPQYNFSCRLAVGCP